MIPAEEADVLKRKGSRRDAPFTPLHIGQKREIPLHQNIAVFQLCIHTQKPHHSLLRSAFGILCAQVHLCVGRLPVHLFQNLSRKPPHGLPVALPAADKHVSALLHPAKDGVVLRLRELI